MPVNTTMTPVRAGFVNVGSPKSVNVKAEERHSMKTSSGLKNDL
jgi:hypothetical protein